MTSVFFNGGITGPTLNFTSNDRYVLGETQAYLRPTLVGSQTYSRPGATTTLNIPFSLAGGSNATPQAGDIVILAVAIGATLTTLMTEPVGYTKITQISSGDTYDSVLYVGYKVMGSTPDTTFPIPSALSSTNSQVAIVYVWRGIDQTVPVMHHPLWPYSSGIDGRLAVPPPVTPTTPNSTVVCIGATAYSGTIYSFSSGGSLSGFISSAQNDTYDSAIGAGYYEWTSGTYTPTAFSISGSTTNDSWTSATLILNPALATVPVYGNYKNSGVWLLQSAMEAATKNTPNNVPGLHLWLDASDSSSLTYSSGNTIHSWKDKKNSITYLSSLTNPPTLTSVSGLGKPAVAFPNATISYLKATSIVPIATPQTIFLVVSWYNVSGYKSIGLLSSDSSTALQSSTGVPYAILYTSTGLDGLPQIAPSSSAYSYTTNGVAEGDAGVVEIVFNTTTSSSSFTIDGTPATPTFANGSAPGTTSYSTIGAPDSLYTAGGAIGEILVYSGILTTEQRLTVRKYLQSKWGTNQL